MEIKLFPKLPLECVASLLKRYTDPEKLSLALKEQGGLAVQQDILIGLRLAQEHSLPASVVQQLKSCLQLIRREYLSLESLIPLSKNSQTLILQQLHYRVEDLQIELLRQAVKRHLERSRQSHLSLNWRATRESPMVAQVSPGSIRIQCLAVSLDDRCVFSSDAFGKIKVWDLDTCMPVSEFNIETNGLAKLVDIGDRGLLALDNRGVLSLWNWDERYELADLPNEIREASAVASAIAPDNGAIVYAITKAGKMIEWRPKTQQITDLEIPANTSIQAVEYLPEIERIVVVSDNGVEVRASDSWGIVGRGRQDQAGLFCLVPPDQFVLIQGEYVKLFSAYQNVEIMSRKLFPEGTKVSATAYYSETKQILFAIGKQIQIFNIGNWQSEAVLEGHEGIITTLVISQSGMVVSGDSNGETRFWAIQEAVSNRVSAHEDMVQSIQAIESNKTAVSIGKDRQAIYWPAILFQQEPKYDLFNANLQAVCVNNASDTVAFALEDKTIHMGEQIFPHELADIVDLAVMNSPERVLIGVSSDGKLWSERGEQSLNDERWVAIDSSGRYQLQIRSLPQPDIAEVSQTTYAVEKFDIYSGEQVLSSRFRSPSLTQMASNKAATRIAMITSDSKLILHDTENAQSKEQWLSDPFSILVHDKGLRLSARLGSDYAIRVHEVKSGKQLALLEPQSADLGSLTVTCFTVSQDGKVCAAAFSDGIIRMWSLENWASYEPYHLQRYLLLSNNRQVLQDTISNDLFVLEQNGSHVVHLSEVPHDIRGVAVTPDNILLVARVSGNITAYDLDTQEMLPELQVGKVEMIQISPDGSHFVFIDVDGVLRTYDNRSGKSIGLARRHEVDWRISTITPEAVIFSDPSHTSLRIFDLKTEKRVGEEESYRTLKVTQEDRFEIKQIAFTPLLGHILAVDDRGTIYCWTSIASNENGMPQQTISTNIPGAILIDSEGFTYYISEEDLRVWHWKGNNYVLEIPMSFDGTDPVQAMVFDTAFVLKTQTKSGKVISWNLKTGFASHPLSEKPEFLPSTSWASSTQGANVLDF